LGVEAELAEDQGVLDPLFFLGDRVDRELELGPFFLELLGPLLVFPKPRARGFGL